VRLGLGAVWRLVAGGCTHGFVGSCRWGWVCGVGL